MRRTKWRGLDNCSPHQGLCPWTPLRALISEMLQAKNSPLTLQKQVLNTWTSGVSECVGFGLTSHSTLNRSFRGHLYRPDDQTNSVKALSRQQEKGKLFNTNWLTVIMQRCVQLRLWLSDQHQGLCLQTPSLRSAPCVPPHPNTGPWIRPRQSVTTKVYTSRNVAPG